MVASLHPRSLSEAEVTEDGPKRPLEHTHNKNGTVKKGD
jgi:hypothetical protein